MRLCVCVLWWACVSVSWCLSALDAQENVTVNTLYQSPYGAYEDLEIAAVLTVHNKTSGDNVTLSTDAGGNLTAVGSGYYQLSFRDGTVDRPYSFLQAYNGAASAPTACQNVDPDYAVVYYLNSDKTPVNSSASLPASGYAVCVRGTE